MKTTNYSKLALLTASISFVIGTLLFICQNLFDGLDLLGIGLIYIIVAFFTNSIILLLVTIQAIINKQKRQELLLHASVMLINIPIVFLYMDNL